VSEKYLYNRVAYVNIIPISGNANAALKIEELRITAEIKRTLADNNNPDTATIKIYNLAETTRNYIQETDMIVQVFAGYSEAEGVKLIYSGDIVFVGHSKSSVNVETVINAHDGGRVMREKKVAVSYGANTNIKQILKDAVNNLGLPIKIPIDKLNIPDIKINNSDLSVSSIGINVTIPFSTDHCIPARCVKSSTKVFV